MLTKQNVLDSVKQYFGDIAKTNGGTGSGWGQCALSSLLKGSTRFYYTKKVIEDLIGEGAYESWPEGGFYQSITSFNDEWIGRHLTIAEVNFFLSGVAAKYNLEFMPIKIIKPVRFATYEPIWENIL